MSNSDEIAAEGNIWKIRRIRFAEDGKISLVADLDASFGTDDVPGIEAEFKRLITER